MLKLACLTPHTFSYPFASQYFPSLLSLSLSLCIPLSVHPIYVNAKSPIFIQNSFLSVRLDTGLDRTILSLSPSLYHTLIFKGWIYSNIYAKILTN